MLTTAGQHRSEPARLQAKASYKLTPLPEVYLRQRRTTAAILHVAVTHAPHTHRAAHHERTESVACCNVLRLVQMACRTEMPHKTQRAPPPPPSNVGPSTKYATKGLGKRRRRCAWNVRRRPPPPRSSRSLLKDPSPPHTPLAVQICSSIEVLVRATNERHSWSAQVFASPTAAIVAVTAH